MWDNPWKMETEPNRDEDTKRSDSFCCPEQHRPKQIISSISQSHTSDYRRLQSQLLTSRLAHAHALNSYALLSTASVWGKGHVIFWLHRHNILSKFVYYIHDSHNKFSLFFCPFILSLGVILVPQTPINFRPWLPLIHVCFIEFTLYKLPHKVSLNEAIARLWATAFKAH